VLIRKRHEPFYYETKISEVILIVDRLEYLISHLQHLFDRFYRADSSRNSRVEGNGLGLAIVKKMADMQQISVTVNSIVGEGTRFDLRFSENTSN
jgi:signal transduction histidine kinase